MSQVGDTLISAEESRAKGGRRSRPEPKLCSCGARTVARGMCSRCYNRWRWARDRPVHDDDPVVELARSCLDAGWPQELAVWFVPRAVDVWPRSYPAAVIIRKAQAGRARGAQAGRVLAG